MMLPTPIPYRKLSLVTPKFSQWMIFGLFMTRCSVVANILAPNVVSEFESYAVIDDSFDTLSDAVLNPLLIQHDSIDEQKPHIQVRRQADETITTTAAPDSSDAPLVEIPEPIFFPEDVASFQLALQSDNSIVAVMGGDNNIYLANQATSGATASTFSLIDLGLSNESYVALVREKESQRYLHAYKDIRDTGFSRIRFNLESRLPCNATLMFWTFVKGYMQFFRGGEWFYDTVGCLDPETSLVKLWAVNGQQGLTALQEKQGECGLAPLVAINFS